MSSALIQAWSEAKRTSGDGDLRIGSGWPKSASEESSDFKVAHSENFHF